MQTLTQPKKSAREKSVGGCENQQQVSRKNGKDDLLIALLAPKARHDSDNTPTNEKIALSVIEQCCRPVHGVFFRTRAVKS
jgi:hypothetical protein